MNDDWLKARLSDLVWLKGKPRNTIRSKGHRRLPLPSTRHRYPIHGGRDCWPRAISLARMLKWWLEIGSSKWRRQLSLLLTQRPVDDGFGLWLADLLKSNGLGRANRADVARKLEVLAREFDCEGDLA